jgi:hypothetical protein
MQFIYNVRTKQSEDDVLAISFFHNNVINPRLFSCIMVLMKNLSERESQWQHYLFTRKRHLISTKRLEQWNHRAFEMKTKKQGTITLVSILYYMYSYVEHLLLKRSCLLSIEPNHGAIMFAEIIDDSSSKFESHIDQQITRIHYQSSNQGSG